MTRSDVHDPAEAISTGSGDHDETKYAITIARLFERSTRSRELVEDRASAVS